MRRIIITLHLLAIVAVQTGSPGVVADSAVEVQLEANNYQYGYSTVRVPVKAATVDELFVGKSISDFRDRDAFLNYYLNLVPVEGRDFLFEALSKTVFAIDIEPLVSVSTEAIFTQINSPINYFNYMATLGMEIRTAALKNQIADPAELQSERFARIEKLSLFDDYEGYLPVPVSPLPYSHGTMERLFSEVIWKSTLCKAGYDQPVVFSGFVASDIAQQVLNQSLFLDDTVFGMSWGHGKFTHLIQLGMLLDSGTVNKQWMSSMIDKGEWRHILDRIMSGWSGLYLTSAHKSGMRNLKTIPGLSSPNWLQESLIRHLFSDLVAQAAADNHRACSYLELFFNETGDPFQGCQRKLEFHASNIRALENWVIFDFLDDMAIMKEQAQVNMTFRNSLRHLITAVQREYPKGPEKDVDDILSCYGRSDCDSQFLHLIGLLACMATFHNSIVEPFVRLREQYYLSKGYQQRSKGQGFRVYLLPEPQEVCSTCQK